MKYGIIMCLLLIIPATIVFLLYCNVRFTENNIGNLNQEITNSERVAGSDYSNSIVNPLTLGRVLKEEEPFVAAISDIILMAVFYFTWVQLSGRLHGKEMMLENGNLTPADYSVKLTGIPLSLEREKVVQCLDSHLENIFAKD